MTKLKTLKDLREYLHSFDDGEKHIYVRKDDLKQEAIKWFKVSNKEIAFDSNRKMQLVGMREFIRDFFNITEEDLK